MTALPIARRIAERRFVLGSAEHALWRAAQIHQRLQAVEEALQVRWCFGRVLTYPAVTVRGYGVHGTLVAVYSRGALLEWIERDLLEFVQSQSDTRGLGQT